MEFSTRPTMRPRDWLLLAGIGATVSAAATPVWILVCWLALRLAGVLVGS